MKALLLLSQKGRGPEGREKHFKLTWIED